MTPQLNTPEGTPVQRGREDRGLRAEVCSQRDERNEQGRDLELRDRGTEGRGGGPVPYSY